MIRRNTWLAVAFAVVAPCAAQSQTPSDPNRWQVDPSHSAVSFRVRHLGITWVNGVFRQWTVDLLYDPQKPEAASVTARIQSASVNTDNERRDADIRAGYLATDSFPEFQFVSTKVERVTPERLRITGNLTMRGITRPTVLDAEIGGVLNTQRGRRAALTATTTIRRADFGITRNSFMEGAQVVGDEIRITIDLEATAPSLPASKPTAR